MLDDAAGAAAAWARLAANELAERRARDVLDASRARALLTGNRRLPRLDSVAPALLTDQGDLDWNLTLDPGRRLLELELDLRGDVGSTRLPRPCRHAEHVVAEEGGEDVGQAAEIERRRAEAPTAQAGMAEAVVQAARLGF